MESRAGIRNQESGIRIAAVISVLAFLAYNIFPLISPPLLNSPDENANAVFAREFSERGSLALPEPLEEHAEGYLAPRSTRAIGNRIVPASFVGLPVIYGALVKILPTPRSFRAPAGQNDGVEALLFFTPLFAAVAVFLWSFMLAKLVSPRFGRLAGIFLAFHPAVWYYSSRGLLPNMLFVSLAMIAITLILLLHVFRDREKHVVSGFVCFGLSGLSVGLAIFVRASEALWLLPLLAGLLIWTGRKTKLEIGALIVGLGLGILPMLIVQYELFGSAFSSGYHQVAAVPFGIHPLRALKRFIFFAVTLFPLASALTFISATCFFTKKMIVHVFRDREKQVYLIGGGLLVAALVLIYGSARLTENQAEFASIGVSYVRYWLPLFVVSTLFMAWALERLAPKLPLLILILALYIGSSAHSVFTAHSDSLLPVRASLERYVGIKKSVLTQTEPEAVLVVDTTDKIFFPDRRVVVGIRNEGVPGLVGKLLDRAPVYYFGVTMLPKDLKYLHEMRLPADVTMSPVETFSGTSFNGGHFSETLYRFDKL